MKVRKKRAINRLYEIEDVCRIRKEAKLPCNKNCVMWETCNKRNLIEYFNKQRKG